MSAPLQRLLTRDPVTGGEVVVTRLEGVGSGITIEGRFSLGWMGRLTPEQLEFVGLLLAHRNNLQRLAGELGVAYNTARSRLDEVVAAVGGDPGSDQPDRDDEPGGTAEETTDRARRTSVLDRLASGDLAVDEALAELRSLR